jgi:hypothetical protein
MGAAGLVQEEKDTHAVSAVELASKRKLVDVKEL